MSRKLYPTDLTDQLDTLGLLLQVVISAANVSEKAGAKLLLEKIKC